MKKKILILYNSLLHYRIPIFNLLSKKYDLTIAYNYGEVPKDIDFKTIKLTPYKIWKFTLQKENIKNIAKDFDAVIAYGEFAYLKYSFLSLLPKRNFKLIYWGIGAPASYTRKFGEASPLYLKTTHFIEGRGDAYLSYSNEAKKFRIEKGQIPEKNFVAHNTVKVSKIKYTGDKKSIVFLGTLYPQKGLFTLLEAYKKVYDKNKDLIPLEIIGDGILKDDIKKWILKNNLQANIIMHGSIYSEKEKCNILSHAYACISPKQAGLSVLENMGYGVPFITYKSAITGGEIFNIDNKNNGLILDDDQDLSHVIKDININPGKYVKMGENAYNYYWESRTPEHMADGIADAVDYVLTKI